MHWSVPIGMLVLSGGLRPGAWAGFFVLVLLHEMGHAFMVRRAGARVSSINIHALGGHCLWSGSATRLERACIAFAGIWAQLVLMAVALAVIRIWHGMSPFEHQFFQTLVIANAAIAILNLIPIPPLDGAEAWKIVPLLAHRAWTGLRMLWMRVRVRVRRKKFHWALDEAAKQGIRVLEDGASDRDPARRKNELN